MGDISPERKSGCGLMTTVFGRHSQRSKKATSTGSSPIPRSRSASKEVVYVDPPSHNVASRSVSNSSCSSNNNNNPQRRNSNETTMPRGTSKNSNSSTTQGYVNQGRRVPKEVVGISGELDTMINDHQKSNSKGSTFVRASSGNVMLYGHLGNLRQGAKDNSYSNAMDNYNQYFENANSNVGGNTKNVSSINKETNSSTKLKGENTGGGSLCRAISTRMDPEQLKIMGNEDYKNGRFAEALSLYDAAIAIDPKKAAYRSNRSAALTALGRLLEAVFECREAIQIDPHYHRAHHRLGSLHFR
ncbi:inactive TPR repeat-containing thioredoxin TTL3-like protein [Trifolium pratense]|uniref:Inactive TPR repeat-containing thioredoxin TTL3-like protein n=1 Tax=Trifolium pratense TaxID=57577 RepID=A0A2K3L5X6_TRIPR|nr:inactive TPR repeat-containing thioredoxin TTL3-like protein [Trifolium pratense]